MEDIKRQYRPLLVILLILVFPPAAWYLLWRDTTYHRWFTYLLLVYGILTVAFSGVLIFVVMPKLSQLYSQFEPAGPPSQVIGYLGLFYGGVQLALAAYLSRFLTLHPRLENWQLALAVAIFGVYLFIWPVVMISMASSVINPIYQLSSQI